jgi:hypothetical protein
MPPIATKNGEPLKRRRAKGNNFSHRFPQIVTAPDNAPGALMPDRRRGVVCNESGLAVFATDATGRRLAGNPVV